MSDLSEARMRQGVDVARRRAEATGRAQWLVLRRPLPARDALPVFAAAAAASERFYWEQPATGFQIASAGATCAIEAAGPERFAAVARQARALGCDLHRIGALPAEPWEPCLVGGFAFLDGVSSPEWAGFPAARLVLPEWLLARRGDKTLLRVVQRVEPGAPAGELAAGLRERASALPAGGAWTGGEAPGPPHFRAAADAPHAHFCGAVAAALEAIAAGELEKVVVARSVQIVRPTRFDAAAVLARLRSRHPSCASFALTRGAVALVGATPEILLRLEGRRVLTAALAGSAPRGRSPEADEQLGRELLESKKEQSEHAVVVRALREALAPLCDELGHPEAPRLQRLEGIQHLHTPLEGRLRAAAGLLDLLPRLHPTPAVGGSPRRAALDWIACHEALERGWYAGPVGYVDDAGGGEMRVALRCALLRGGTARLFAGAGVVAGSQPEAELRETRLKLAAMLDALVEL